MQIGSSRWIQFRVDVESGAGHFVKNQVVCTSSAESDDQTHCFYIEITSRLRGKTYTTSANGVSVCSQELRFKWGRYTGSTIIATVQQTANSSKEVVTARHVPGLMIEGKIRLSANLSNVDALRYIASNADIADAFGTDIDRAREHYDQCGRFEGRLISFEPLAYLASYPDLEVLGLDEGAACVHFIRFGRKEGRSVWFRPKLYLARHPDVRDSIVYDEHAATRHYLTYGRREGRPAN